MASRKGKSVERTHPVAVLVASGVLLLSVRLATMSQPLPRVRVASLPPQTLPPALPEPPRTDPDPVAPLIGPPVPPSTGVTGDSRVPAERSSPGLSLPMVPPLSPQAGEHPSPVHGPQWQGAPLPAFSPDLLQAMMDPRAARRARRLRRLGIILPAEPASTPQRPGQPTQPGDTDQAKATRVPAAPHPATPAAESSRTHPSPEHEPAGTPHPAPTGIARLERPEPTQAGPPTAVPASPTPIAAAKPAVTDPAAGADAGTNKALPAGENGKKEAAAGAAPPAAGPPIQLQARLDHPRPQYRVGEWVALRFLASRPVHLRVYRVDAARRVTQVFSTYSRKDQGSPARTFSMMVKAGEPKPGQEGMIAIGSARPLTRDELLSCLRAYLGEAPADYPAAAGAASAPARSPEIAPAEANRTSLADALQAVIDAVGRAADTPEASPAPLDRSGWSIAVGHFVSADSKVSGDRDQRSTGKQSS